MLRINRGESIPFQEYELTSNTTTMDNKYTDADEHIAGVSEDVPAYTADELNARIDEAEAQMMSGDVLGGEMVHDSMRNYIKSMAV